MFDSKPLVAALYRLLVLWILLQSIHSRCGDLQTVKLINVLPPWERLGTPKSLPIEVPSFEEHVGVFADYRGSLALDQADGLLIEPDGAVRPIRNPEEFHLGHRITARLDTGGGEAWLGTDSGLYVRSRAGGPLVFHQDYGVSGPLATRITALAKDSRGVIWVGTPLGLSIRTPDLVWHHIRGRDGLPVEQITALAIDSEDDIWVGTTKGAVLHRPYSNGRRWYYRQGPRYLPGDRIKAVTVAPMAKAAFFLTDQGVGRIDIVRTTLVGKAEAIERRLSERHRRLGLVASCVLDQARNPSGSSLPDNDNDGLWTAYHVAAQSLARLRRFG